MQHVQVAFDIMAGFSLGKETSELVDKLCPDMPTLRDANAHTADSNDAGAAANDNNDGGDGDDDDDGSAAATGTDTKAASTTAAKDGDGEAGTGEDSTATKATDGPSSSGAAMDTAPENDKADADSKGSSASASQSTAAAAAAVTTSAVKKEDTDKSDAKAAATASTDASTDADKASSVTADSSADLSNTGSVSSDQCMSLQHVFLFETASTPHTLHALSLFFTMQCFFSFLFFSFLWFLFFFFFFFFFRVWFPFPCAWQRLRMSLICQTRQRVAGTLHECFTHQPSGPLRLFSLRPCVSASRWPRAFAIRSAMRASGRAVNSHTSLRRSPSPSHSTVRVCRVCVLCVWRTSGVGLMENTAVQRGEGVLGPVLDIF